MYNNFSIMIYKLLCQILNADELIEKKTKI